MEPPGRYQRLDLFILRNGKRNNLWRCYTVVAGESVIVIPFLFHYLITFLKNKQNEILFFLFLIRLEAVIKFLSFITFLLSNLGLLSTFIWFLSSFGNCLFSYLRSLNAIFLLSKHEEDASIGLWAPEETTDSPSFRFSYPNILSFFWETIDGWIPDATPWDYSINERVLVSTVNSCPTFLSWSWWCTKGKGKVNRCTTSHYGHGISDLE